MRADKSQSKLNAWMWLLDIYYNSVINYSQPQVKGEMTDEGAI